MKDEYFNDLHNFIAVFDEPNAVQHLEVGMSNEDITLARISFVARQEFGIIGINEKHTDKLDTIRLRNAAKRLIDLAIKLELANSSEVEQTTVNR